MLELKFRVDSRLVTAQWSSYDKDECLLEFFEWDGSQATVIGKKTLGKKEACWHDARAELLHDKGEGVERDYTEAAKRYRLAAEQGNAPAQFLLGSMYEEGKGVPQDHVEAAKWYRRAAEQGYDAAQLLLGTLHAQGKGVPQSDVEATKWYRRAAEQGDADAQLFLGTMYGKGEGVPQDYVLAHTWLNLAASRMEAKKREDAVRMRDRLVLLMTPEQIAEAQRLAREWKPKPAAP